MSADVSVLVPTRDRPRDIRRCIESVLVQTGVDTEVIVFDDASVRTGDGPTLDVAYGDAVRVLRTEEPVGAARARNVLAEAATGDVLVYLDDDAYLRRDGLLHRARRAFDDHPDAGIIAFRIVDHLETDVRLRVPFSRAKRLREPDVVEREQRVSVFLAGGYAIRADVMADTGGYEDFLHYMVEEQDLSFKTLEAGHTIRYVPDVRVEHERGARLVRRSGERTRTFYNTRNRAYLARRHLPARYLPTYLAYWLLVLTGQAVSAGDVRGLVDGIREAWAHWSKWPRDPLSEPTLRYLRRYGGRVWF